LKITIIYVIRICDVLSFIIALAIIFAYLYTNRAWYLSDLISMGIMGTSVKLFKIRSLKDACFVIIEFNLD